MALLRVRRVASDVSALRNLVSLQSRAGGAGVLLRSSRWWLADVSGTLHEGVCLRRLPLTSGKPKGGENIFESIIELLILLVLVSENHQCSTAHPHIENLCTLFFRHMVPVALLSFFR